MNQSNQKIHRAVIIGGIHGNELTGVYITKLFEQFPHLIQRPSFETLHCWAIRKPLQKAGVTSTMT